MNNLDKAKEIIKERKNFRISQKEFIRKVKELKVDIEKHGCKRPFWSGRLCGGKCNEKVMLCNDCQEAIKLLDQILK